MHGMLCCCHGPRLFLNRIARSRIIHEASLPRPLIILAAMAALALIAGFLAFGGANMGN